MFMVKFANGLHRLVGVLFWHAHTAKSTPRVYIPSYYVGPLSRSILGSE